MTRFALFYLPRYTGLHYTDDDRLRDQQTIGIDMEDVIHALLETKTANHDLDGLESLRDMVDEHIDDPVGRMTDHELNAEEQKDWLERAFKAQSRVTELMHLADIYLAAYQMAMHEAGELLKLESFAMVGRDSYRVKFKVRPRDSQADTVRRAAAHGRRNSLTGKLGLKDPNATMAAYRGTVASYFESLRKLEAAVEKAAQEAKACKPPKGEDHA